MAILSYIAVADRLIKMFKYKHIGRRWKQMKTYVNPQLKQNQLLVFIDK